MCRINVFSFVGIKHRKSHQVLEKDLVPNFVLGVQLGHLQTEQVQKKKFRSYVYGPYLNLSIAFHFI